jgi:hypothetical protein
LKPAPIEIIFSAGYARARGSTAGTLKKNQQGEIAASISIAKVDRFRVMEPFIFALQRLHQVGAKC